jgi:hypothetical protein
MRTITIPRNEDGTIKVMEQSPWLGDDPTLPDFSKHAVVRVEVVEGGQTCAMLIPVAMEALNTDSAEIVARLTALAEKHDFSQSFG